MPTQCNKGSVHESQKKLYAMRACAMPKECKEFIYGNAHMLKRRKWHHWGADCDINGA